MPSPFSFAALDANQPALLDPHLPEEDAQMGAQGLVGEIARIDAQGLVGEIARIDANLVDSSVAARGSLDPRKGDLSALKVNFCE
jgi:hypothetical protein